MGLFKALLRALGLSNDARVKISAPGIEVELTGDPERVSALLDVVKHELEGGPRRVAGRRPPTRRRHHAPAPAMDSKVVRPTELDEMDSPYALPEAVVMPVAEDEVATDEQRVRHRRMKAPLAGEATTLEPDTQVPRAFRDGPSEETLGYDDEPPDDEATAVSPNPSGPVKAASRLPAEPATLVPREPSYGER